MYDIPIQILRSPENGSPLNLVDSTTLVDSAGNRFKLNTESGYWNLLPTSRSPLYSQEEWDTFQKLIDNFLVSYNRHPEVNVSYAEREDAFAFGEFCQFRGKVLDVGSGPHKIPSYIKFRKNPEAVYYGVDILAGEHPKDLNFVQGMGEHLPFVDDLFDVTISGTSLLHYVNAQAGIQEALRVTKPTGHLCIWLGVKSKDAPKPKESPDWYKALETPQGAENPFHYKRWTGHEFEGFFDNLGATIVDKATLPIDEWRENIFYRLKK